MIKPFKPLLADPVDFAQLDYGNCWLSPKLDGIRVIIRDGVPLSRKLLTFPNKKLNEDFGGRTMLEHYDGEFIQGDPADDPYSRTYSACMKAEKDEQVTLYVFDHVENPIDEYFRRYDKLSEYQNVVKVPQHPVTCLDDILELEAKYLGLGYEGIMLRAFQGPRSFYKYGRSTAKETTLLKLKRFTDFEARIVGIEEEQFNGNEATKDELGRTKRSSAQAGKVGKATMGKMNCIDLETGIDFNCGIFKGFDAAWKQKVWDRPELVVGQIGKFQKFGPGEKDRPRHPKFLGLRAEIDL